MKVSDFGGPILLRDFINGQVINGKYYKWSTKPPKKIFDDTLFFTCDTKEVLDQVNCVDVVLMWGTLEIIANPTAKKQKSVFFKTYFQYGVDANGAIMNNETNYVAAPCPPYCSGGI